MNCHHEHGWFVAFHSGYPARCKDLRQLPPDAVDRRNQSYQDSRIGHLADEKGNDGNKGGKSESKTKESAIDHVCGDVVPDVVLDELFFGVGERHGKDFTQGALVWIGGIGNIPTKQVGMLNLEKFITFLQVVRVYSSWFVGLFL